MNSETLRSEIQDGRHGHHFENIFALLLLNRKANLTGNLWEVSEYLVDWKLLKPIRSEVKDARHGRHLENSFRTSCPLWEGQLALHLVGSIGAIVNKKMAKIVPIRSPRWPPSWKSILRFFSWTERPTTSKLHWKYQVELFTLEPLGRKQWPYLQVRYRVNLALLFIR